jgi:hypothetical protein
MAFLRRTIKGKNILEGSAIGHVEEASSAIG